MPFVHATILGGLPVVAEVWFSGPDYYGEYDCGVNGLYWQKRDGSKGAPLSQRLMDRLDRQDHWEADVTEQANDWLSMECPIKRRNPNPGPYTADNPEWIIEGEYGEGWKLLNGDRQ